MVKNYDEARAQATHSTWLTISDERRLFWIEEYVPFTPPATTSAELKTQLTEIMKTTPEFDALFAAADDVVSDPAFEPVNQTPAETGSGS